VEKRAEVAVIRLSHRRRAVVTELEYERALPKLRSTTTSLLRAAKKAKLP
jgi:hypothetical protein